MFEDQTKEELLQRMLAKVAEDVDKRQGSVIYDMLSPAAIEFALAYVNLDLVLQWGFADTSYGPFLELRVGEVGLFRKPATFAIGKVKMSGADGTVIPIGTIVTTDEEVPLEFETTTAGTISGGFIIVDARCRTAGTIGNVAPGLIKIVKGDLASSVGVVNEEVFYDGFDIETDADLLKRYQERTKLPYASGTAQDYKKWALEIPGISDCKVFPLWQGNRTVKIVLISPNKRTPSANMITQAINHIEEMRPIDADVTIVGATEVQIDVDVKITLTSTGTLEKAIQEAQAEITKYLSLLAFVDTVVRIARIGDNILNCPSILDYQDLKINLQTGNIQVTDEQIPVLGRLTITL